MQLFLAHLVEQYCCASGRRMPEPCRHGGYVLPLGGTLTAHVAGRDGAIHFVASPGFASGEVCAKALEYDDAVAAGPLTWRVAVDGDSGRVTLSLKCPLGGANAAAFASWARAYRDDFELLAGLLRPSTGAAAGTPGATVAP
jgi:hypothetical protein